MTKSKNSMRNFKHTRLPRRSLGFLPTPIIEARRLSERLQGPRILIKRDDQTGLAFGGNKVRKLEFLVGEALSLGRDVLITAGAAQSNHCRQTAAAAAACGLDCHLALGGQAPDDWNGNLLIDEILGAKIHWTGDFRKGETIPEIYDRLLAAGRKPYVIPYGGSNSIGAIGFVKAAEELKLQLDSSEREVSHIVFASSSGGTQAGLLLGKSVFGGNFKLVGIGVDKDEADIPFERQILSLVNSTAEKLEIEQTFASEDIVVRKEYTGDGYGALGELERRAIKLTAETEGLLLDPVYTGRAMGALIDMIEQGEFSGDDTVLFWHTGGSPALFHSSNEILGREPLKKSDDVCSRV